MAAVKRYHWNTPEYADAFAAFLRASGGREQSNRMLRCLLAQYPREARAVDWGAGRGDLTAVLLEHCAQVYAVEPSADMRAVLAERCPKATIVPGTIMSTTPPAPVEVGVISHVFYHVADHEWGAHVIRAADCLSSKGVLAVILNDPDSGTNRMLEDFGAPRFDLYHSLAQVIRRHKEYDFAWSWGPVPVQTRSFEDTLKIARFVLCDRDETAFARQPAEKDFQEYVRAHFWDEVSGVGGWDNSDVYCFVRPHPAL
jgi:hypothetical protein